MTLGVATKERIGTDGRVGSAERLGGIGGPPRQARRAEDPWRTAHALVRLARPRQWIKNLLVAVAPLAGGVLLHPHTLLVTAGAFVVFCLAAAGTYAVNDALDVELDRIHPDKVRRPVASGALTPSAAIAAGACWLGGAAALAWALAGWRLFAVVGSYIAITIAYSRWLKHEPVVDLLCVSAGFVLRAAGGGVATHVALSTWFLLVISFGALLIVCGKRSGEVAELGDLDTRHRPALKSYPATFLQSARVVALSGALVAYCLWAFERSVHGAHRGHALLFELSVVPVIFVLLRLELLFQSGHGSAPEELALHDRTLQIAGIAWVAVFALGVYA